MRLLRVAFSLCLITPLLAVGPRASAAAVVMLGVGNSMDDNLLVQPTHECSTDLVEEAELQRWQGKKNTYLRVQQEWGEADALDAFFQCLTAIWNVQKSIPTIAWFPPKNGSVETTLMIKNGYFDGYLTAWAQKMKAWLYQDPLNLLDDRRAFISLLPEANGRWHCWSWGYEDPAGQEFAN